MKRTQSELHRIRAVTAAIGQCPSWNYGCHEKKGGDRFRNVETGDERDDALPFVRDGNQIECVYCGKSWTYRDGWKEDFPQ